MSTENVRDAEARVAALMKSKEPMTREKAIEGLSALLAAGRVKAPTRGGPPPALPRVGDED